MLAAGSLASYAPSRPAHVAPQLYRRFFTPAECEALDSASAESALSEISLLRILLTRVVEVARQQARRSHAALAHLLSMLAGFSRVVMIIASLVRFEARHFGLRREDVPIRAAVAHENARNL